MGVEAKPDFSGYATKAGLKCSDGRTIMPGAFKHQDGDRVPLVWQHNHSSPENVLGYAVLEHRDDGVYAYGYFNDTSQGQNARHLVQHEDVKSLSIYANQLAERAKTVLHGMIREVSLVLSGANPGALIDNITLAHGDDIETLEDEAIIYTGEELRHDDESEEVVEETEETEDAPVVEETEETEDAPVVEETEESEESEETEVAHADGVDPTVQEVYDAMSPEQKDVVHYLVGAAIENATQDNVTHSDDDTKEGTMTTRNVFEQENGDKVERQYISHSDLEGIVSYATRTGSLRDAVKDYALQHGIENIDVLFPEARTVTDSPEFLARRVEWVTGVLNGTRHSPFSRIKSLVADITFQEARAKGYVKGNFKKEEWIKASKRTTTPATVYKKQKLDRDDIIDITDFDVVAWIKAEMRLMFDEELARAILIGDGRASDDEDKIKDPAGSSEGAGIRSILNDDDLYAPTFYMDHAASGTEIVDEITKAMGEYKGSGSPIFYTTLPTVTNILLTRDEFGHRLWKNMDELAQELGVAGIVTVEVMEDEAQLAGIIVNLRDYTIGADKGGETTFFDFFDIDYNQYKYLYESRLSGALTKIRSALVIKWAGTNDTLVSPGVPTYDPDTGIVTVPNTTGVVYKDQDSSTVTNTTITLDPGEEVTIYATPASTYYFADNVHDNWTFKNDGTS